MIKYLVLLFLVSCSCGRSAPVIRPVQTDSLVVAPMDTSIQYSEGFWIIQTSDTVKWCAFLIHPNGTREVHPDNLLPSLCNARLQKWF